MSFYRLARLEMYVREKHLNFDKKNFFLKLGNFPTIYRAVFSTNFGQNQLLLTYIPYHVIFGLNKPNKPKMTKKFNIC